MSSKRYQDCGVFDIETDGLKPTKVHLAVLNEVAVYSRQDFEKEAGAYGTLVAHNGLGYDFPVLRRLWDYAPQKQQRIRDTLVMARLADPERPSHSLESFAEELGGTKVANEEWAECTDRVVERCFEDVKLTQQVLEWCEARLEGVPEEAIEREQKVYQIIRKQIDAGWLLDHGLARELIATLKERVMDLEDMVRERFRPLVTPGKEVTPKWKKDGTLSKVGLNCYGDDWPMVAGPFTKVTWDPFNLGSRQQIARYLKWFGWKPKKFTDNGHPIVDEKVLEDVDIPEAQLIQEYLMCTKRIAQVQSWLDNMDDEGRVHGYVNSNGAVTGRMTHSGPNMGQVPGTRKPHGKECRSCWIVPEGYKLVGMDADGLELRMLAHYMQDPDYTAEVEGGDVHTKNQKAAGLPDRDTAKTFIYAFLYGAGAEKIGKIAGTNKAGGQRLKDQFLANTPALADLIDRVKTAAGRGFIWGLDGRKVKVRSAHAALNTLLQSAGAIVMKEALVLLDEYATKWGLRYRFVGNVHDEVQAEVHEEDAEKFSMLANACMEKAGINLGLRVKLKGSSKIGDNWSETH